METDAIQIHSSVIAHGSRDFMSVTGVYKYNKNKNLPLFLPRVLYIILCGSALAIITTKVIIFFGLNFSLNKVGKCSPKTHMEMKLTESNVLSVLRESTCAVILGFHFSYFDRLSLGGS